MKQRKELPEGISIVGEIEGKPVYQFDDGYIVGISNIYLTRTKYKNEYHWFWRVMGVGGRPCYSIAKHGFYGAFVEACKLLHADMGYLTRTPLKEHVNRPRTRYMGVALPFGMSIRQNPVGQALMVSYMDHNGHRQRHQTRFTDTPGLQRQISIYTEMV